MIKERLNKKELMDDPSSDTDKLIRTVKQFKNINILLTASRKLIKRYFLKRLKPNTNKPYSFVDLGAGGCDVALWVSSWCRKRDINIQIICIENDSRIVPFALSQIKDNKDIELMPISAFQIPTDQEYDFIFSNHFLHHLPNDAVVDLLKILKQVGKVILMNDLDRNILSFIGYKIFASLFLHNSFANYDGGLSVLRSFKKEELLELLIQANLKNIIDVKRSFPGRLFLVNNNLGVI